eukprot:g43615.t1
MAFFDLAKAFNTSREELCVLLCSGCTMKLVTILRLLHHEMEVVVITNGSITDPFPIWTGIKQGCVITPTLFSISLAAMLHLTTDTLPTGVELTHRTSGNLFNVCHLQIKTKITPNSVIELQCADEVCVCAISEDALQTIISIFAEA